MGVDGIKEESRQIKSHSRVAKHTQNPYLVRGENNGLTRMNMPYVFHFLAKPNIFNKNDDFEVTHLLNLTQTCPPTYAYQVFFPLCHKVSGHNTHV